MKFYGEKVFIEYSQIVTFEETHKNKRLRQSIKVSSEIFTRQVSNYLPMKSWKRNNLFAICTANWLCNKRYMR